MSRLKALVEVPHVDHEVVLYPGIGQRLYHDGSWAGLGQPGDAGENLPSIHPHAAGAA